MPAPDLGASNGDAPDLEAPGPEAPGLDVLAGYILAYRLFDVAYAIDLARAEGAWARKARPAPGARAGG